LGRGRPVRLLELHRAPHRTRGHVRRRLGREEDAAVERIEQHRAAPGGRAHDEVAGEPHAGDGEADPAADLDGEYGERDGDAELTGEDVVEAGIARIVVGVRVSFEAFLLEEKPSETIEGGGALAAAGGSNARGER